MACRPAVLVALLVTCGLAISTVFVLRPAGQWAENDTAVLAVAIQGLTESERLASHESAYPHGYAYQVVAAAVMAMSGISSATFQQTVSPFLFALVLLPIAWVAYRELLGDARGATLATSFLLLQPELLFIALRGSHEKITRALLLLALFLLARSLQPGLDKRALARYLVLYYLVSFGILASNNLFGSSFFAALTAALAAGLVLARWRGQESMRQLGYLNVRLVYGTLVLFCLAVVFTFYVYRPAADQIWLLRDVWERVGALLLRVERPSNPYTAVAIGWVSVPVFFLVSLSNWLVLGVSGLVWLREGWTWFVRPREDPGPAAVLLWLLYGAFAAQEVIAVVVDFSGAIASNFQYRAFASFSLVAIAVLARGVLSVLDKVSRFPLGGVAVIACAGALALLSSLKATNEPLLSNKWMFYTADELRALRWTDGHLEDAGVWTEFDERLTTAHALAIRSSVGWGETVREVNYLDAFRPKEGTRDFLVSDVTRRRAARLGVTLPVGAHDVRTYDNGAVQVYHLRPETAYQR